MTTDGKLDDILVKLVEIQEALQEQDAFVTMIAHCMKVQMDGGGHHAESQKFDKLFKRYEQRRHAARNGGFQEDRDTDPAPPDNADAE